MGRKLILHPTLEGKRDRYDKAAGRQHHWNTIVRVVAINPCCKFHLPFIVSKPEVEILEKTILSVLKSQHAGERRIP